MVPSSRRPAVSARVTRDVFVQGLAADVGQSLSLGPRQSFQRISRRLRNADRQAWRPLTSTGNGRPAAVSGRCSLGDFLGQLLRESAPVGEANVLASEVDVWPDRPGLDVALGHLPFSRSWVGMTWITISSSRLRSSAPIQLSAVSPVSGGVEMFAGVFAIT